MSATGADACETGTASRSVADMVAMALANGTTGHTPYGEGKCLPLRTGSGFRYIYDRDAGQGGWEFHYLTDAISLAIIDFTASRSIAHMHRSDNHLVLSAVLEGRSPISSGQCVQEELAHGFCTITGLDEGETAHTMYMPGKPLRWVSLFLNREKLQELCGLDVNKLPGPFRDFALEGRSIGLRSIPLPSAASMAASQIFECRYSGEVRRMYLVAKSLEILCAVMHSLSGDGAEGRRAAFTGQDAVKVRLAREIVEENLEDPLSVAELARVVGLSRQKLQLGCRILYNSSVGRLYKQVRLARAVTLVSETTMPMIEIALECGYEHAGSFTRAFKAAFGDTPVNVRSLSRQRRYLEKMAQS